MPQNVARSSLGCLLLVVAGCTEAPPPAPPVAAGPTCEAGECNARGMQAVALARYDEAIVARPRDRVLQRRRLAAARDLFDRACRGGEADGCTAAQQLAQGPGKGGGRPDQAIALTSSAPTFAIAGLRVHDLVCRMPEVGPMALAEAVEALAVHKAGLDACAPQGAAPAVSWTWRGGRAAGVKVRGGGPKVEACVRKTVERARSQLTGGCAAVVLVGAAEGAQRMLAEQRSAGSAVASVGSRGVLAP